MTSPFTSNRAQGLFKTIVPLLQILSSPVWAAAQTDPDASNFLLGNPQEMPLSGFVSTLQRWLPPKNKDWFAYKMSEPTAQAAVAKTLQERRGIPFEPADIAITNGA